MTAHQQALINAALITNPNYDYANNVEKYQGFLSKQFPTTANPAPLGLCAFALTTFVLSMINAGGLVSIHSDNGVVMGLALFYGGVVQVCAGMWEFKTGNTFGAVAFSSYGGFWMSFASLKLKAFGFLDGYTDARDVHDCLGIYLLAWLFFTTFLTIAAHRTTIALASLLFIVIIVFLMLSISEFTAMTHPDISIRCQEAGGVFGVIAAFLAWYCGFASLLTKTHSLFVLPVGEFDPIYRSWGWLPPLEGEEEPIIVKEKKLVQTTKELTTEKVEQEDQQSSSKPLVENDTANEQK